MGRYEAKDITWNANACYDELPEWLAIPQRVTDGIADDKERRRAVDDYLEFLTGWKVVGYVLTETKEAEKRA